MDRRDVSRREYLIASGTAGLAAVAGCSGQETETDEEPEADPTAEQETTEGEPPTTEEETTEEAEDGETTEDDGEPEALGDEWRTFQNDVGRSGYSAASTVPTGPVTEAWRHELDASGPPEIQPTLVDGTVYTAFNCSDGSDPQLCLLAVDAVTGERVWRQSVTPATSAGSLVELFSATAYGGGRIYAETGRGYLVAVDAATGSVQWDRTFDSVSDSLDGSLLYADGTLYAHAGPTDENEGGIRALDATTGEERWSFTGRKAFGTLALADETLVAKAKGPVTTYGLDPESGAVRWETDQYTTSRFGCSDGTCYAYGGDASAFATDGSEVWTRENVAFSPTAPDEYGPAIANGRAFFRTAYDGIVALDAGTGDELWRVGRAEGAPATVTGNPVLGGDGETVYTTAGTHALAIDAAPGEIQWQYDLPDNSGYASDVIVGNNALYLTCDSPDGALMLALA